MPEFRDVAESRAEMKLLDKVREALRDVKDPEIPTLSLEELGMVRQIDVEGNHVSIRLLPTFVGCPAVELIRGMVAKRILEIEDVHDVDVTFVMDVAWTSDMITDGGRRKLSEFGIAPPPRQFSPQSAPSCPYCGAADTNVVSLFGPTACRAVYYCKSCQQPFEGMKFV